jgi:hypothetical protein
MYTVLYPPFSRHSLFASGVARRHEEQARMGQMLLLFPAETAKADPLLI